MAPPPSPSRGSGPMAQYVDAHGRPLRNQCVKVARA